MTFDDTSGQGGGARPYSIEDMIAVSYFLRGAELDGVWFGGIRAEEAFEASCRIMQLPAEELRRKIDET